MQFWKTYLNRIIGLIQRFPRAVAVISFALGIGSFLLVNRQNQSAGIIAAILLISWLWLVFESLITQGIAKRFRFEVPPVLLRYITQVIHQESFFFVLPFFFITTTWNSGQLFFTGFLGVAALIAIIDPVYYEWLAKRRWIFMAFHTLALFAVLLTALPVILHLTTNDSYRLATGIAAILAIPTMMRGVPSGRRWIGFFQVAGMTLALAMTLWFARHWVPPATLWLADVHVTTEVDGNNRTPGKGISTLTANELFSKGLYAYTAVRAPRGLGERIFHVWMLNGKEVDRIALNVRGGRKAGYRTWTHKKNFPADPVGDWKIQVMAEGGQMIGVVRFKVTPLSPNPSPTRGEGDFSLNNT